MASDHIAKFWQKTYRNFSNSELSCESATKAAERVILLDSP